MRPYIVAVFNQKGGISKTTTSTNLSVCLSAFGKSVVVIDLDSQGDSTKSLGADINGKTGIYDLFTGGGEFDDAIVPTMFEGVALLPSTYNLAGIEIRLSELKDSQRTLVNILGKGYIDADYIVIDCPPALGILPINALAAAHAVIIPVTATPYANDGLMRTLPSIKYVQEGLNKSLLLQGVLFTINDRNKTTRRINDLIRSRLGGTVYRTEIPRDNKVIEAASAHIPVCAYAPRSPAAIAHLDFAAEFIDRHHKTLLKAQLPPPMPPRSREEALSVLLQWQDRHARGIDKVDGERIRKSTAQLNRALYGERGWGERLHIALVHFFIDNRFWLVAFLLAILAMVAGILVRVGVSGLHLILPTIGF